MYCANKLAPNTVERAAGDTIVVLNVKVNKTHRFSA